MRMIFADTSYWVALIDGRDQWHEKSTAISKSLGNLLVVTTDEVLTEVLAFSSQLMKAESLTDALTTDGHFTQEGFTILLKEHTS
jgi:predicted nucleic acid-binding protein